MNATGVAVVDMSSPHCASGSTYPISEMTFLAYMCHEIRTPIGAIIGLAHILSSQQCTPQRQKECTDMLRDTSGMLSELLDGMLDFAKIDAGMLELEQRVFNLEKTAGEAMLVVAVGAQAKGLTLQIDIGGDVPSQLVGDPLRLRQILVNLLANAVKFTTKGMIRLSVSARISAPGYYRISIVVADTGIGLTPEQCERIFDKYTQAHASISHKYGGTGLGLSICQALASLMHGDITVRSTPGMGSEFEVTLQLASVPSLSLTALDTTPVYSANRLMNVTNRRHEIGVPVALPANPCRVTDEVSR